MPDTVRTRFAPSPTGFLHVGGARTALFNWLYARKNNGVFVLRIEDTDAARNTRPAVQAILDGLNWLGLDWDEGPGKGGDFGPYLQSERGAIYERYFEKLKASDRLYEDGGAFRFRSSKKPMVIEDLVCGKITMDRQMEPDMTIRRPDGSWIFHFVNVVDDIEMQISHVIRGEDHLSNTPKHLELYEALGAPPPKFAHIPLILNRNGSKMSKRDEGASLNGYMEKGYVPEAVRNYLCLLGWSPKDNREKLEVEEVIRLFDLDKINRRNAGFDIDKCFWLNGQYILSMSDQRFLELVRPVLDQAGIVVESEEYLRAVLGITKEKIKLLADLPDWVGYFFTEDFDYDPAAVKKVFGKEGSQERVKALRDVFQKTEPWTAEALEAALKTLAAETGEKTALFVHPARVAVSGKQVGPSLYAMLEVMGRERVLNRLGRTLDKLPQLMSV